MHPWQVHLSWQLHWQIKQWSCVILTGDTCSSCSVTAVMSKAAGCGSVCCVFAFWVLSSCLLGRGRPVVSLQTGFAQVEGWHRMFDCWFTIDKVHRTNAAIGLWLPVLSSDFIFSIDRLHPLLSSSGVFLFSGEWEQLKWGVAILIFCDATSPGQKHLNVICAFVLWICQKKVYLNNYNKVLSCKMWYVFMCHWHCCNILHYTIQITLKESRLIYYGKAYTSYTFYSVFP